MQSLSFAQENMDLDQLTSECLEAAKKYIKIQEGVAYKVLHTVEYEGWAGDPDNFKLRYPVSMKIRYAGALRSGYYWYKNNPHHKHEVKVNTDFEGNIEIISSNPDNLGNLIFKGLMRDKAIKGVWETDDGEKAFAFYVKVVEKDFKNK